MIGPTGSGETALARALAGQLGVPHVELDALFWKPDWVMSSAEELRAKVEPALVADGWVVDGNYSGRTRASRTDWISGYRVVRLRTPHEVEGCLA